MNEFFNLSSVFESLLLQLSIFLFEFAILLDKISNLLCDKTLCHLFISLKFIGGLDYFCWFSLIYNRKKIWIKIYDLNKLLVISV